MEKCSQKCSGYRSIANVSTLQNSVLYHYIDNNSIEDIHQHELKFFTFVGNNVDSNNIMQTHTFHIFFTYILIELWFYNLYCRSLYRHILAYFSRNKIIKYIVL